MHWHNPATAGVATAGAAGAGTGWVGLGGGETGGDALRGAAAAATPNDRKMATKPPLSRPRAPTLRSIRRLPAIGRALIRVDDRAQHDTTLFRVIVARASMHRRPLVPDQQIAHPPRMVINKALLSRMRGE